MKLHHLPLQSPIRPFSVLSRQFSNEKSLSTNCLKIIFLEEKSIVKLVVDDGTGITALGLALGASCLRLQWEITTVMLADTADKYREHEKQLISDFRQDFAFNLSDCLDDMNGGIVQWMEQCHPRKLVISSEDREGTPLIPTDFSDLRRES